jgi:hypothetical protein
LKWEIIVREYQDEGWSDKPLELHEEVFLG